MKGRPKKENSKGKRCEIRLSDEEEKILNNLSNRMDKSKSDVIRRALDLYNRMTATERYRDF